MCCFFLFKQKTAYELRISDWSSDVCSSDLVAVTVCRAPEHRSLPLRQVGAGAGAGLIALPNRLLGGMDAGALALLGAQASRPGRGAAVRRHRRTIAGACPSPAEIGRAHV